MKSILLSWSFVFLSFCVSAQTWKELNDSLSYFYKNGDFEKGIIIGEEAVTLAKKEFGENHPRYATSLNNLAGLYSNLSQYEKAESMYIRAKDLYKKALGETHPNYATSLNNLAELYVSMGHDNKAEPLFIQSMEIRKEALGETDPHFEQSLNNLIYLYERMGQYERAEPFYIQIKERRKKNFGENHPQYAESLNNLALLYRGMGKYEKAEPIFINAIEINRKTLGENHPHYAISLYNLGLLYEQIGLNEKAASLFVKSIEIEKKVYGEMDSRYAKSLNQLGGLYLSMGPSSKAEPFIIQAKEIRKKVLGENHLDYATSLDNEAALYLIRGKYEKSEPLYIQSKEIRRKILGENHIKYASSINNLALLYQIMGKYEEAESLCMQASIIFRNISGETHPLYATSLNNLALILQSMGQYKKAEPFMISYSKIILEKVKNTFAVLSEKEKMIFLHKNISLLQTQNSFIYNYRNASSPIIMGNFNLQLFFKSLALTDTRNMRESILNSKDDEIKKLFDEWQNSRKLLAKQYSLPVNKRLRHLDSIETNAESLEKELNLRSGQFRNEQQSLRITFRDVYKNLQQDEAAIEFVSFRLNNKKLTDSTIYAAYIIRKQDSIPIFVPLFEEKQLQQLFDSAGKTATSMVSKFYRGLEIKNKTAASLGTQLYKLVWQPLEPYLKSIKKISYSPAGKLYSIAFHALPVDSKTLLIDKYNLQQYTSARQVAIRTDKNQTTKPSGIALFGNANFSMDSIALVKQRISQSGTGIVSTSIYTPQNRSSRGGVWNSLPGTATEIKKIKSLFDENKLSTKSFVQTAASEENLKALSGNSPQILHIATHGFFLPEPDKKKKETGFDQGNTYTLADDPLLRSGLILSGGNYAWSGKTPIEGVEDGIVTAYEISQLNLSNTELVVLSACETALGDVKGSEGVFGLQRAFKMAGVKKMIVSLWQVPDKETAELMTSFYTYWMKGKSINESFTQAQADMRKKHSPFYWAAFVLVE